MVNVDFKFDFASALAKEYHDSEIYQSIADIAKGIDINALTTEDAIRKLIKINSTVLANVLEKYNYELLNEIEL
ncbi:MAG: hypothetical protein ACLR4P_04805 [Butyribacter sp.]|uniref:hypothetical protein n=1 Tax=Butyribacter sp. TaxID=2822465 RepID=UPI0039A0800A